MEGKKVSKKVIKLDKYEADLEKNVEKAKPLAKKEKAKHVNQLLKAADSYVKKDKRISIRVYGSDLEGIKRIALQEGLPYQTLLTSVIHKFVTGQLSQKM